MSIQNRDQHHATHVHAAYVAHAAAIATAEDAKRCFAKRDAEGFWHTLNPEAMPQHFHAPDPAASIPPATSPWRPSTPAADDWLHGR